MLGRGRSCEIVGGAGPACPACTSAEGRRMASPIRSEDVAASAAFLVGRPRSARTFELEAGPSGETW
jgi:hypothetical protein